MKLNPAPQMAEMKIVENKTDTDHTLDIKPEHSTNNNNEVMNTPVTTPDHSSTIIELQNEVEKYKQLLLTNTEKLKNIQSLLSL